MTARQRWQVSFSLSLGDFSPKVVDDRHQATHWRCHQFQEMPPHSFRPRVENNETLMSEHWWVMMYVQALVQNSPFQTVPLALCPNSVLAWESLGNSFQLVGCQAHSPRPPIVQDQYWDAENGRLTVITVIFAGPVTDKHPKLGWPANVGPGCSSPSPINAHQGPSTNTCEDSMGEREAMAAANLLVHSHWCGEGGSSEGWATVELQTLSICSLITASC